MTIEILLNFSSHDLEALSDKELEECLGKYFHVTRPTQEVKDKVKKENSKTTQLDKIEQLALKMGIKL